MEDFVRNAAPVAVALLVCLIGWVSVRREYRKGAPRPETRPPAE
jgi:hypothetical protein